MSKTSKIIIITLVACLVFATLGLVACRTDKTYTVTYVYGNGTENKVVTVKSGETVVEPKSPEREGYTFDYWCLEGAETPFEFDTLITADITLTAHWTEKQHVNPPVQNTYISWNSGNFAEILIDGISGTQLNSVRQGVEIFFKLHVSPYCKGTAVVKAGDKELTPGEDGWYNFVAEGAQMIISVTGLENDNTPITGLGTASKPYVLSTPANFKMFVDSVNSRSSSKYNSAHVVLDADLSFNGEELEPIGLDTSSTYFDGTFDGRGHTVSNFTMKGQDGLTGLFGYVITGMVKNVNVKDAVYNVDTSSTSNYIVGGIVAYNMGSDVIGCSFAGDITVDLNSSDRVSYIGGIVGFAQGYSTTNSATVSYCTATVDFKSDGSAPLLAVGGIVGGSTGTADSAPFTVNNCIYNGNVAGNVVAAGGVIGYMREDSSIANCYTNGSIVATNPLGYAAAGAFVGMAEQDTAITNSYSTATYSAVHAVSVGDAMSGAIKGEFVGNYYPDGNKVDYGMVDSKEIFILNSYILSQGKVVAKGKYDEQPTTNFTSFAAIKSLLKWNDSEWSYENNALQVVVDLEQDYKLSYAITFDFGEKTVYFDGRTIEKTETSTNVGMYLPLDWVYQGNGENTFKATDNAISYGLFLDEEHTIRLPAAMLLTADITVYVAFSDYSEVAAEYYVPDIYGDLTTITFDDNGRMTMNYGGRIAHYMYVYNGEQILIKDAYFAYMYYESDAAQYVNYYATIENGKLLIYDNVYFTEDGSVGCLNAYKGNAVIGDWYDAEQSVYTFKVNGSGTKVTSNDVSIPFTYAIDGKNVTVAIGGVTYNATLSADGRNMATEQGETMLSLDKFHIFIGDWETDFNNCISVSFDGKGALTFNGEDYGYTLDADGVINYEKGRAEVNANGLIELTYEGDKYVLARAHSYRGVWADTGYNLTVVFLGIGVDGYGYGYDSQGYSFTYVASDDDQYYDGCVIDLYYRSSQFGYGMLTIKDNEEVLSYCSYYDRVGQMFDYFVLTYYDPLQGVWGSDDGVVFNFNGCGAYDIDIYFPDENIQWTVKGEVTITDGEEEQTVQYAYNRKTTTATFTYGNQKYTVKVDGQGNLHFVIDGEKLPLREADMYADVLIIGNNCSFYFDGWSTTNHGVALFWDLNPNHDEIEYSYTLHEDGTVIRISNADGEVVYTLTLNSESGFMVMDDADATELGLYSAMGGQTYVAPGNLLVEVGNFNMDGLAFGTAFDEEAVFEYQSDDQVAIYIDGEIEYYLVLSNYYDNVYLYDADGEFIVTLVWPDKIMGTYTGTDGSCFEFDGRSFVEGYYATVNYVDKDGNSVTLYYVQKEDGTYSVFDIDRTGEDDAHIEYYTVYTDEHQGATKYVSEDGAELWIADVKA